MPAAAIIPIAAGVIGAGASAIAGASGVGKNSYRATNFANTPNYDANRFNYGGNPGGADAAANRYAGLAAGAQGREGVQANYGQANDAYNMGLAARQQQGAMAQMMAQRAQGNVPSISQMQADRQMGQLQQQTAMQMQAARAGQASGMASARGGAGLALAQQNAANNVANMQAAIGRQAQMSAADISGQAQINAAQERLGAEQAAYGAYSGMRAGDVATQQQAAQQSQYNAGLLQQQRSLNDQYSLGMTQAEQNVRNAQLNANMNQQQMLANAHNSAQGMNMGANQANANREMQFFQSGLGAVTGGMGAAAGAMGGGVPGKADGGPIEAGKPYVVGERGPELIVPREHGLVIPNEVLPLMDDPRGGLLQMGSDGRAFFSRPSADDGRPSLEGSGRPSHLRSSTPAAPPAPAPRQPARMDLDLMAAELERQLRRDHEMRMAAGPAARRLSSGSPETGYTTELTPGAESAYGRWRERTSPWDTGEDYDLRGAFAEGMERDSRPGEVGHLPDTYKKPNHETFSDESIYARYAPGLAGHWNGERYTPGSDRVQAREEGGPVSPGRTYLVGERGPELVTSARAQTKAQQDAEDAAAMKAFFGDAPVMKFDKQTAEDKARAEEENRRGIELQLRSVREAEERAAREKAAAQAEYEHAQPVQAWLEKKLGGLAAPSEQVSQRDHDFRAWLTRKQMAADAMAQKYAPQGLLMAARQSPVTTTESMLYADGTPRYGVRNPVSFERGGLVR